ncbi:MAG: NUDIX domain-containing protein [Planctomycetes bacterium]|nr:NUDIX domain-containing protein [Planctomycetota bacterium]
MSSEPRFCCAILIDSRGRYILERRPTTETDAPGLLTSFGGTRHTDEDPELCLRRELIEELGFAAGEVQRVLVLHTPKGEAWFYRVLGPEEGAARALEAGYEAVWMEAQAMFASPDFSDWHRIAYEAFVAGHAIARV